jgi:hypothetical protein
LLKFVQFSLKKWVFYLFSALFHLKKVAWEGILRVFTGKNLDDLVHWRAQTSKNADFVTFWQNNDKSRKKYF